MHAAAPVGNGEEHGGCVGRICARKFAGSGSTRGLVVVDATRESFNIASRRFFKPDLELGGKEEKGRSGYSRLSTFLPRT